MTIFKIYLLLAALGLTAARAFLSLQRVGATFEMPWGGGFSSRWLLIAVASHRGGLSSRWLLIAVASLVEEYWL